MLAMVGNCCEFCGAQDGPLHVHHLTYENLGNESADELFVLCASCHADSHEHPKIGAAVDAFAKARLLGEPWPERDLAPWEMGRLLAVTGAS